MLEDTNRQNLKQINQQAQSVEILEERIKKLEEAIEEFRKHQHLGTDGSREFSGETRINAKEITISGAGARIKDFVAVPFSIIDAEGGAEQPKRSGMIGIYVTGDKEADDEQINTILGVGKIVRTDEVEEIVPSNRVDFNKLNQAFLFLSHSPQSSLTFLHAYRTPVISGEGAITKGADTFTDSSAKFQTDQLAGSILILSASGETRKIVSNTENVITVDDDWEAESGSYAYEIITPIYLGAANRPFKRLYVGEDIRLGYGASAGTQVRYIKWGASSPEGVVTANIGSLYLRTDGGTNTTLYIKTADNGEATGWTAK